MFPALPEMKDPAVYQAGYDKSIKFPPWKYAVLRYKLFSFSFQLMNNGTFKWYVLKCPLISVMDV